MTCLLSALRAGPRSIPEFISRTSRGLPKLDFRAEAVYTDPPSVSSVGGLFIYWEVVYHDLYLNDRYLMGQLDWPRGQRLSGLEYLSLKPEEQPPGSRPQCQDFG